jgi:hypothetical protein
MEKNTPGPWEVRDGREQAFDANGNIVADCMIISRSTGECTANAYLIAAAPELLTALKWMTDEFLNHVNFNPEGGDSDAFHAYINQARIVIAKAEGRE